MCEDNKENKEEKKEAEIIVIPYVPPQDRTILNEGILNDINISYKKEKDDIK